VNRPSHRCPWLPCALSLLLLSAAFADAQAPLTFEWDASLQTIGTVADALSAIKHHVFERCMITMAQLVDALDRNWEGHEVLRELLVNRTPHYGNDDDAADGLAVLAESQRRGRGRQGRRWISPSGANVLMSVLLIEPRSSQLAHEALTIAAGVAACRLSLAQFPRFRACPST
jgi:hypothetical protein